MASYEQTIIIGNVGGAQELRYTQAGKAVFSFSVAVGDSWTDKATGERRESTNWYKVTAWDKQAESLVKYVTKGMQVMVVGTVTASAYTDKDGQPRASLDLTAREVVFLSRATDGNADPNDREQEMPF